jgi:bifunctional DNase/RNase
MPEENEGPERPDNLDDPPPFFPYGPEDSVRERGAMGQLIDVRIEGVFMAENGGQVSRFVLLTDEERRLPILIGPAEATAIQMALEGRQPDRPMTHDLLRNILERVGADLDRVVIDDFWNTVYYAKLYLRKGNEEMEIDARPSDAIALAVRFNTPIQVADGILEAALED